jgi:hypothetical protein
VKNPRQLPLLGDRQEPNLGQAPQAKGGKDEAAQRRADKLEALCAEVYRLTGQKLTVDDPILLAALFQSELINKAGEDAAALFRDGVAKSVAELAEAVKAERERAGNLDKSVAGAFQQIADGAKKAGDQELSTMQIRFARMASETLDQIRRESAKHAPGGRWWRIAALLCTGLASGLIGGFALGQRAADRFSDDQVRLMHNGMLLDAAWPKLPKPAREAFGAPPKTPDARADKKSPAKDEKK